MLDIKYYQTEKEMPSLHKKYCSKHGEYVDAVRKFMATDMKAMSIACKSVEHARIVKGCIKRVIDQEFQGTTLMTRADRVWVVRA